jgi:predicted GIY-YIG superfamily endonuclease
VNHYPNYKLPIPSNSKVTYVLKLEDECWYVGVVKNGMVNQHLRNHITYGSSGWCKVHKPLKVVKVLEGDREMEITLKMLDKYGGEKVRGWNYVKVHNPSLEHFADPTGVHGCLSIDAPEYTQEEIIELFNNTNIK